MEFHEPPCIQNDRKQIWMKNVMIILFAAVLGWYVNYVRVQIVKLKTDVETANTQVKNIIDARLDTLYKISEIGNEIKDLRQSQNNFRQSVQKMVENEINKMYSDKTGRTDFALESAGGRIVQLSPGTENYGQPKNSLLGISLCEGMHGPRAMIQTGTSPGECWAFKGSNGGAVIKLLGKIKIDAISLEHISKTISPSGDSTTAPKDFTVWGLKTPTDRGTLLGQYSYNIEGPLVQTFTLATKSDETYEFVELRIISNHGNPDFTCIYRFRVHGEMEMRMEEK
ncbi:SUN domain-containing protein 1-like isoform X2 [Sitophilus oryzae]|nr:SUN domain-containing protein 1-like isoform X2 [Sitophilus oryzae]